ncbi:hypothetical protein K440DRAFT_638128 [Wilcoxina mikolae CBS 423.85]|nr:hypothetical protein K440DRAFT_638128 [Wilcoxina mikolae CBS 423.85]
MPPKPNIRSVFAAAGILELQHLKIHYALVQAWLANGFHLEQTTFHPNRAEHSMPKAMLRTVAKIANVQIHYPALYHGDGWEARLYQFLDGLIRVSMWGKSAWVRDAVRARAVAEIDVRVAWEMPGGEPQQEHHQQPNHQRQQRQLQDIVATMQDVHQKQLQLQEVQQQQQEQFQQQFRLLEQRQEVAQQPHQQCDQEQIEGQQQLRNRVMNLQAEPQQQQHQELMDKLQEISEKQQRNHQVQIDGMQQLTDNVLGLQSSFLVGNNSTNHRLNQFSRPLKRLVDQEVATQRATELAAKTEIWDNARERTRMRKEANKELMVSRENEIRLRENNDQLKAENNLLKRQLKDREDRGVQKRQKGQPLMPMRPEESQI